MSHRTHLINTCAHIRSRGKSRGARKKELGSSEYLFWQADLLAEGLQPRIAAQQSGMFTVHAEQEPAHPDGPNLSHVVQNFEGAIFVAQTGEQHGGGVSVARKRERVRHS